jgi:glycine/D-amino acid oxidase-like deaminating enzyme
MARADVLILGGGIIGSSLAWALATRGVQGIRVVDLDLGGLYASSELNAGGARATWWQPVNIESCLQTLDFFREHAQTFGFEERGYLWLYDDPELYAQALEKQEIQNRFGLGVEDLDRTDIRERAPLVDRAVDELVGATFSPRDGIVNPNAVRGFYRKQAEALGVEFQNHHYVTGVETARQAGAGGTLRRVQAIRLIELERERGGVDEDTLRSILTTHHVPLERVKQAERIECEALVNCLGAWSPILSAKIGVTDVTQPVRRQICLVDVHAEDCAPGVVLPKLGMIVDPSGLYLHGEGAFVLAGYSTPDEVAGFDFGYDGQSFFESEIWPRLAHRASSFEHCGHVRGWAGLYAVTPDCSGIADRVAGFANLFEAHSFTGRGVMQSYGVGQAMASLVADGRYSGLDLSPLARDRFEDLTRWVPEELHI